MPLEPGTRIGPYTIVGLMGAGGMGEVYRAHDPRLKRDVAIKILSSSLPASPEMRMRFEREAMAASALNHPNIVTIHDAGEVDLEGRRVNYIAMELIDGETLTARMTRATDAGSLLNVFAQVAEALARAHEAGIVHRDLKPDNIMITRDGFAKILDFGLVKLVEKEIPPHNPEAATAVKSPVSRSGVILGTVAYMSPEQARGVEVDHRSDIFSFGSILYEACTGQRAWNGGSVVETLYKIIHAPAADLGSIPSEVQAIVRRCLAKVPDERYQSAREIAVDLRRTHSREGGASVPHPSSGSWPRLDRRMTLIVLGVVVLIGALTAIITTAPTVAPDAKAINAVAVLPFRGASDPDSESLSQGIAESIINRLSRLSTPRVMARSTVFHYKDSNLPPADLGRELGVDAIITGEVSKRGDRLRVDIELVDVSDGSQLWSEKYERSFAEILSLERDIAVDLVRRLRGDVPAREELLIAGEESTTSDTYELYLKGRYWWNKRSPSAARRAVTYFQQAIDSDPGYARAWAGMADCYNILGAHGAMEPKEAFARAKAAARQALTIDPTVAEAYASLADANIHYDWNWKEAERNLRRAIELSPNYGTAHHWYSEALVVMGRSDEGLTESKRARELEPLSIIINSFLARHYYYRNDYVAALAQARQTLDIEDSAVGRFETGRALAQLGKFDEAITEYGKAEALSSELDYIPAAAAHAFGAKGDRPEWERRVSALLELRRSRYVSGVQIAIAFVGGGETEKAIEWLRTAVAERDGQAPFIGIEPVFASLRNDSRFQQIVSSVGGASAPK